MKKRFFTICISILLLGALILQIIPFAGAEIRTGSEQARIQWTYDTDTKTLTISGKGKMDDFGQWFNDNPWEYYLKEVKTVVISDGITRVGSYTFPSAHNLESVILPDSVVSIGAVAFQFCKNLKTINIPKNLEVIEDSAFSSCKSLTEIEIPASVRSISPSAFCGCESINAFSVSEENPEYCSDKNGALYNKSMTRLLYIPGNFSGAFEIPETVQTVEMWAFNKCGKLTEVTFPKSVSMIDSDPFFGCEMLTDVRILNPDCQLCDRKENFGNVEQVTLHGYAGSTTQQYAEQYGYSFSDIKKEQKSGKAHNDEQPVWIWVTVGAVALAAVLLTVLLLTRKKKKDQAQPVPVQQKPTPVQPQSAPVLQKPTSMQQRPAPEQPQPVQPTPKPVQQPTPNYLPPMPQTPYPKIPVAKEEPPSRFCLNCGAPIREKNKFCARCGTKLK